MFTGIIEETGTVRHVSLSGSSGRIQVGAALVLEGTKLGDSIAVNGVCLTVTSMDNKSFTADVMAETLRRSNLGQLKGGDLVNLERAMPAEGRFGGHIVSGHIDGTGTIASMEQEGNATWVYIRTAAEILALIVEKGSIAIDGISLTVAKVGREDFAVSIIPHTGSNTTLLKKKGWRYSQPGERYSRQVCAAPSGAVPAGAAQKQDNRGVFKGKWILSTTR